MMIRNILQKIAFTFVIISLISLFSCTQKPKPHTYYLSSGPIQGTMYNVTYQWDSDISEEIDSILQLFNKSLSNYDKESTISKINRNETDIIDDLFEEMVLESKKVFDNTNGMFDITIAPIANLWSFGWEKSNVDSVSDEKINAALQNVGLDKVNIIGNKIVKDNPEISFISNAIAQGQSVDYLSRYLLSLGLENFLVEIGGEISCKGVNPDGNIWRIGIDKPIDNSDYDNRENQIIVHLTDKSIATSGNYRKFVEMGNEKLGHSLNPVTGKPANNSLLSVTVVTDKCILADAYATAFMVMGLEKSIELAEKLSDIEAYVIYLDNNNNPKDTATTDFLNKYVNQ